MSAKKFLKRASSIGAILITTLLFAACKKDKLEFQRVEKLESHTADRLNSIKFIDNTTGYIIGGQRFYNAMMLITKDGGNTWTISQLPDGLDKSLYGITYGERGIYACGFDAKLFYSNDGGENWSFTQVQNWKPFKDLAMIDPNTVITISGISFNSGDISYLDADYKVYRNDTFAYELNDIEMLNNRIGYISGYGVIMKTSNGANTWDLLDIQNDNFTALHVRNEQEVWTCGYNGSIFHTADGGKNWEKLRNGNSLANSRYKLLDIVFKDESNGWAVGEEGVIISTKDGGHSWKQYERFTENALRSIVVAPDGNLITVGDGGVVYKLWTN